MKLLVFLLSLAPVVGFAQTSDADIDGAWSTTFETGDGATNQLSMIIQDGYFVMTAYNEDNQQFISTLGGSYETTSDSFLIHYEWDSSTPANVGQDQGMGYIVNDHLLVFNGNRVWQRVDDGEGPLAGAWQITGRKQDGEMRRRTPTGPRRTMKILSGSRFQWIAYNTETKEMLGTGGGTYTSTAPQYIEKIEFFSRDPERVGDQLSFDYKIRNNEWHHMGFSSKGDPLYETWGHRSE
ncbi:membrane or secreted protein [Lewinella sp. IMCC34191]|uniref:membrane or secreted protein n=1 Tax=Lewinella sp. IMCC34191 TaxID=2259172 RepID=UPI000E27E5F2|nr:membrane or secreted protein [Lewinella sp. IMCC34191]